jgi:hypothetical protein
MANQSQWTSAIPWHQTSFNPPIRAIGHIHIGDRGGRYVNVSILAPIPMLPNFFHCVTASNKELTLHEHDLKLV